MGTLGSGPPNPKHDHNENPDRIRPSIFFVRPSAAFVFSARRASLASDAVFRALSWTDTYNVFLTAQGLADLIDEDVDEIRRVVRGGKGSASWRSESFVMCLRAHGIIPRVYYSEKTWCLLGIGAVESTFSSPDHLFHAMNAEPRGMYL